MDSGVCIMDPKDGKHSQPSPGVESGDQDGFLLCVCFLSVHSVYLCHWPLSTTQCVCLSVWLCCFLCLFIFPFFFLSLSVFLSFLPVLVFTFSLLKAQLFSLSPIYSLFLCLPPKAECLFLSGTRSLVSVHLY